MLNGVKKYRKCNFFRKKNVLTYRVRENVHYRHESQKKATFSKL